MEAFLDVLRRYGAVFRAAWRERKSLVPVERTNDERAFLPAHLELMESPASPAPRWSAWIIMLLFVIALLWACFGKLDIVAVAPGRVVPSGRTKIIQPSETAVVHRILVHDGQAVKKGQLLIELDAVGVTEDESKARQALASAKVDAARTAALIDALENHHMPHLAEVEGVSADRQEVARQQAESEYRSLQAQEQGLRDQVQQKQAELNTVNESISPLSEYAAIAKIRVSDYGKLIEKGYVSKQDYLTRRQELIDANKQLATQRSRRAELESAIKSAREQLRATVADARRKLLDEHRKAQDQIEQFTPEVAKTAQRNRFMKLRSPVDGTVGQLAIHTIGGVVTPAQALMQVVPSDKAMEVEATVLNQDIGFVRTGQHVAVKVTSFPYTRYGYLTGTVETISHDAAQDKKLGLVFPAHIRLDSTKFTINGVAVEVTPGMSLNAEIRTGKRSVIDYLLSPLETHVDEALRER
ncbi:HlyD family type I secretion periplasmic adaptor subunit [Oleiagrimonas sp. MCCC 1A03011]|uniref:HlyD family type I secretion periplasmic adaptor subunit n=1 Tax=Oleiagrimonas sp. MCCC 1A03011 TaxID=1926883 RepID=UPI001F0C5E67|nr:HlyD family type I secretion periplasmic adaptor subunit [Oleiagrimonas sp. MCCC 1A03011]